MKKRIATLTGTLVLSALGMLLFAAAAEADVNTMVGQSKLTYSKKEIVPVGDVEGHILQVGHSSGPNTSTGKWDFMSGGTCGTRSAADIIKGNGTHAGYFICEKGGDKTVAKYEGIIKTILTPEGKPYTTFSGVWDYVRCEGKFKGCTGNGVYSGHFESADVVVVDFRGTLAQ